MPLPANIRTAPKIASALAIVSGNSLPFIR
jgi:hypothetical protein